MINQIEVPMYMEEEIPELAGVLRQSNKFLNVYQTMNVFLEYTCQKITEHNTAVVKKCFLLAEMLYDKGNRIVKNAIENVFVYSFSHLPCKDKKATAQIMGLIPGTLYSVYMHQVLKTSI